MTYFDFTRLIEKYTRPFTVILKSEGSYNAMGDWVDGENSEREMRGALMSMSERKIYNSNGLYTSKDKILHMTSPIENALLGAEVIFKENVYKVEEVKHADNEDFTGVYSYVLKWVSVFNRRQE